MISNVAKFWKEIAVFLYIFGMYVVCCQPDYSFIGFDCDLGDFIATAKYGTSPHFPGYSVMSVLSLIVIRIPLFTEGWRFAFFLSVIPSFLSCVLVYLAVYRKTYNRNYAIAASLVLAAAGAFFVQSIIVEVYAFSAMMFVLTYVMILYKRFVISAILCGVCFTMHPMLWPAAVAFIFWSKELRGNWKYIVVSLFLGYAVVIMFSFLGNNFDPRDEYYERGLFDMFWHAISINSEFWFQLPIWHVPSKIWFTVCLLAVSFGIALIPMFKYLIDYKKSRIILAVCLTPFVYYFGTAYGVTIVHFVLAFPFLAIAAGIGMGKTKIPVLAFALSSIVMLSFMPLYHDIGRSLDAKVSASSFYEEMEEIENGSVIFNLVDYEYNGNLVIADLESRSTIMTRLYEQEHPEKDFAMINVERYTKPDTGAEYRMEISKDRDFVLPFLVVDDWKEMSNDEKREAYYGNMKLFCESNPNANVYHVHICQESQFSRKLVKYACDNSNSD